MGCFFLKQLYKSVHVLIFYRAVNCMNLIKRNAITGKTQRDRRRGESQKVERQGQIMLTMGIREPNVSIREKTLCLKK